MSTRNVNLSDELDHFVAQKVKSGRYEKRQRSAARRFADFGTRKAAVPGEACRAANGHGRRGCQRHRQRQRLRTSSLGPQASCASLTLARLRFSRGAEVDLLFLADCTLREWRKAQTARYIDEPE